MSDGKHISMGGLRAVNDLNAKDFFFLLTARNCFLNFLGMWNRCLTRAIKGSCLELQNELKL